MYSRSVSNAIGALTRLTYLNLSNNMLDDLPGGMAALKGLQVRGVGREVREESFPRYSALLTIRPTYACAPMQPHLRSTSLLSSSLPLFPPPLQVLDLSHNQLQELPCWLPLLSRLSALHLQHNQLDSSCQEVLQVGGRVVRGEGGD